MHDSAVFPLEIKVRFGPRGVLFLTLTGDIILKCHFHSRRHVHTALTAQRSLSTLDTHEKRSREDKSPFSSSMLICPAMKLFCILSPPALSMAFAQNPKPSIFLDLTNS